ncbi:hypothetical protein HY572_01045 [Candidatus Micrarchaeota archaeon]|nr:hypothetical protein [Candidatus Micrarchaeota archaeon]
MVDVLIRNVDPDMYARFKSDAAARKLTLAEELKLAFESLAVKKGLGKDLLDLPVYRGPLRVKNPSERVDELFAKAAYDDYLRLQRGHRARTRKR